MVNDNDVCSQDLMSYHIKEVSQCLLINRESCWLYVLCLKFPPDNNVMSSVGWTATGRVETQRNSESKAKIEPMTPATSVIHSMELHEFQGARSLMWSLLKMYFSNHQVKFNLSLPCKQFFASALHG